jgi:hypothetical protein
MEACAWNLKKMMEKLNEKVKRFFVSFFPATFSIPVLQNTKHKPLLRASAKFLSRWRSGQKENLFMNGRGYSTVTDFARLRGWSTLHPRITAM